jgi:diguanylate cyclase (GGDEF)-like protein
MTLRTGMLLAVSGPPDTSADLLVEGRLHSLARWQQGLVVAVVLLLAAVGGVTWVFLERSQQQLIEFKAMSLAEVVARQATSARTVYAEHVVAKLRKEGAGVASETFAHEIGNVPLPAQFLKLVGRQGSADSDGLYRYSPISKWNLGDGQGLRDDFQRWAWEQLEAQDQPSPAGPLQWASVWRVEDVDGQSTLRMMRADPAASKSCVQCHNDLELRPSVMAQRARQGLAPGRQWRQHQLLGALEVQVPLASVEALAARQRHQILTAVTALAATGALLIGALTYVGTSRARRLTEQLAWHAGHDSLTGLANRRQFEQRLLALERLARADGGVHALMILDLDQFKVINDTCGHQAGDRFLRELSEQLKAQLRGASDTLARLGGDEFGVLLPGCSVENAQAVAQKLIAATGGYELTWNGRRFGVGVSIGLVEVNAGSGGLAELMSAADMACYAAKDDGRNRVRVFQVDDAALVRRREQLDMGERLTSAMAAGRMSLAVQTARALDPALPVQAYQELLLRVFEADGRLMNTGAVIAAAEQMNMMSSRVDRWVLQTACMHIASGRLKADERHVVAVNISGQSLSDERFLAFARETVQDSGIDPRWLCLEITETAAMANLERAKAFMQAMKELGCLFALDDFGSGLSSFGYLKHLQVDFLKLDGAFVRDVVDDPTDRALVGAIGNMGQALHIPTIAEWVENDAICDVVRRLGIGYAQGWGIEKPRML